MLNVKSPRNSQIGGVKQTWFRDNLALIILVEPIVVHSPANPTKHYLRKTRL